MTVEINCNQTHVLYMSIIYLSLFPNDLLLFSTMYSAWFILNEQLLLSRNTPAQSHPISSVKGSLRCAACLCFSSDPIWFQTQDLGGPIPLKPFSPCAGTRGMTGIWDMWPRAQREQTKFLFGWPKSCSKLLFIATSLLILFHKTCLIRNKMRQLAHA